MKPGRYLLITKPFQGKKGMEMWQLVLMIIAIVLLVILLAWYGALGKQAGGLIEKLGDLF